MDNDNVKKVLALLLLGKEKEAKEIKLKEHEIKVLADLLSSQSPNKKKRKRPRPIFYRRLKTNLQIAFQLSHKTKETTPKKFRSRYRETGVPKVPNVKEYVVKEKTEKPKKTKEPSLIEEGPYSYLKGIKRFTKLEASKFGHNFGMGARPYIEAHQGEWKWVLAEEARQGKFGPIMKEEGLRYQAYAVKLYDEGELTMDRWDMRILYGKRRMYVSRDDPVIASLTTIIEGRPQGDIAKWRKLLEMREEQLSVSLYRASLLIEKGETIQKLESKIKRDDLSWMVPHLTLSMITKIQDDMEGFWKKFYSHFNEADPFYAVGRGDEGMAYGSLIEWIVTNPSPEFDPSNLTALAASEKFKEAFFKNVVDLWGEQEAITWFVENVLAGGAVYKPVSKGYLRKIRAEKPSKNEVNLKMTNEQFKWTIHETAEAVKKKKVVVDEEPEGNEGL